MLRANEIAQNGLILGISCIEPNKNVCTIHAVTICNTADYKQNVGMYRES